MMICPACNYELSVHSDACEHCGAPSYLATAAQVTEITHCTYCGARNDTGSDACPTCGLKKNFKNSEKLIGTCRNCGTTWRAAWMYCLTCGVARENGLVDTTLPTSFSSHIKLPNSTLATARAADFASLSDLYESAEEADEMFFPPPDFSAAPTADPHMLLSEHEVVERMYVNGESEATPSRKLDLADFFSESEIAERLRPIAAPENHHDPATASQVVYDLPTTAPREAAASAVGHTAHVAAAIARARELQPALPAPPEATPPKPESVAPVAPLAQPIRESDTPTKVTARTSAAPLPKPNVTPPAPGEPSTHKTEAATTETKAKTKPATGPVQAVRVINRPHPPTAPPIDKKLIKIIAVLIFFILVFSALIVSGFRLRDLFGQTSETHIRPSGESDPGPASSLSTANVQTSGAMSQRTPEGMVPVSGGTFRMGREDGDMYESPPHEVTLKPFYMDRTEVTNAQYAEFLKATNHPAPPDWKNGKYAVGADKLPVVNVSWQDANDYASWAGKRLPTEAEWEFAARAQDTRRYPWGSNWDATRANTLESNLNRPVEADSYAEAANPFGLLNLSGNVWEWINGEVVSYKDTTITLAPGKVIRGGAYYLPKERATTTYRGFAPADKISERIGFRCVQDAN